MVPAGELEVQEIIKIQILIPRSPRPHLGRGAARSDILSSSCLPDRDDGAGLDIFVSEKKGFLSRTIIYCPRRTIPRP